MSVSLDKDKKARNPNFIISLGLLLKWIFLERSNHDWQGLVIKGGHKRRWNRGRGIRGIWKIVWIFAVVLSGVPLMVIYNDLRLWCTGPVVVVAYVLCKGVLYYGAKLSSQDKG